ncbi:MAG: hypothetical protein JXR37_01585 [Kiritimatiellae bacterium]|nr:hypothetical protein [Kiritimatiellia bacterium]
MKKLKVLVLFDSAGPPPENQDYTEQLKTEDWFTEAAVIQTLREEGHEVRMLGVWDDITILFREVKEHRPDVVFNLTEVFLGTPRLDKNIAFVLELCDVPYTGCSPFGMMICNNKALTKKILNYHRVKVPQFEVFRRGRRVRLPKKLRLPLIVKPLNEEASTGIAQASFVEDEKHFRERVEFIHEHLERDAIAEEYVAGRELYASILGYRRLHAFPLREMTFTQVPEDEPRLATYKAKWDQKYREKWGIKNVFAPGLSEEVTRKIMHTCKRAYRALSLDAYARFDFRLTPDNDVYILEANANPELALGDEFAESAAKGGYDYNKLIRAIVELAFQRE